MPKKLGKSWNRSGSRVRLYEGGQIRVPTDTGDVHARMGPRTVIRNEFIDFGTRLVRKKHTRDHGVRSRLAASGRRLRWLIRQTEQIVRAGRLKGAQKRIAAVMSNALNSSLFIGTAGRGRSH